MFLQSRNPGAFDKKFAHGSQAGKVHHKVGCKCRKSACLKKYVKAAAAAAAAAATHHYHARAPLLCYSYFYHYHFTTLPLLDHHAHPTPPQLTLPSLQVLRMLQR